MVRSRLETCEGKGRAESTHRLLRAERKAYSSLLLVVERKLYLEIMAVLVSNGEYLTLVSLNGNLSAIFGSQFSSVSVSVSLLLCSVSPFYPFLYLKSTLF